MTHERSSDFFHQYWSLQPSPSIYPIDSICEHLASSYYCQHSLQICSGLRRDRAYDRSHAKNLKTTA